MTEQDDNTTLVNGGDILELARKCPLLLPTDKDAVVEGRLPLNQKKGFTLQELYQLLDCDTVEVIRLNEDMILIGDEEAKLKNLPINEFATVLWYEQVPEIKGHDVFCGPALLCHTSLLK